MVRETFEVKSPVFPSKGGYATLSLKPGEKMIGFITRGPLDDATRTPPGDQSELPSNATATRTPPSRYIGCQLYAYIPTVSKEGAKDLSPPTSSCSLMESMADARRRKTFCEYVFFIIKAMFEEMEYKFYLDITVLFSALILLTLGTLDYNKCSLFKSIQQSAITYGVMATAFSTSFILFKMFKIGSSLGTTLYFGILRLALLLPCIYGIVVYLRQANDFYVLTRPENNCEPAFFCFRIIVFNFYFIYIIAALLKVLIWGLWNC